MTFLKKLSNAHNKVFLLCLRILNVFFFPLRTPERRNNRGRLRALNCREEEGGFGPKRVGSTLSILLKITEKLGTAFALQTARPSLGSDEHVKMAAPPPIGDVKTRLSVNTFEL